MLSNPLSVPDSPAGIKLETPVLLLIFNRPARTAAVFNQIKLARPAQLFVQADGPREGREEDLLCRETREITEKVDWPCEVHRLYRDTNQGCRQAISGALDWFFEHVEKGIILEDDCVPQQQFFHFAESMLLRFNDRADIMNISGVGFRPDKASAGKVTAPAITLFPVPFIWGWATWRRAWQKFRKQLPATKNIRQTLDNLPFSARARSYWMDKMRDTAEGKIDSWAYPWVYTLWAEKAKSVMPTFSLIENTGMHTDDATHPYQGVQPDFAQPWESNLVWPSETPLLEVDETLLAEEMHLRLFRIHEHIRRHPLQDFPLLWQLYLAARNRWKRLMR